MDCDELLFLKVNDEKKGYSKFKKEFFKIGDSYLDIVIVFMGGIILLLLSFYNKKMKFY